jgi:hypothetical protein
MPDFLLYLESGEDIGVFRTSTTSWRIGDELINADLTRFRIIDVVTDLQSRPPEHSAISGLLVVSPLELAEPT